MTALSEAEIFAFIDQSPAEVHTEDHARMGALRMQPAEIGLLNRLDPFGSEYRQLCEALYLRIAQRAQYNPSLDEKSGLGEAPDVWRGVTPFAFRSSRFVAEFLVSWAAIFDALDMSEGQSILEYGPGSGQILLMLARCGMASFGVDIDQDSLDAVRGQSNAMNLDVALDRAEFGGGFEGRRFDRILFYEAFHHALKFEALLLGLHDRLNPGGKLLLAGEPIVPAGESTVPYPWGPRMDGLSLFCIRRRGWMELGFQSDFFVNLMMRCGWLVQHRPSPVYRANVYVAEAMPERIMLGAEIMVPSGWSGAEGTHRWTSAEIATLPLPVLRHSRMDVEIELVNFLGETKRIELIAGTTHETMKIASGQTATVLLRGITAPTLEIRTTLTPIKGDIRKLGIAVRHCVIKPAA